MNRVRDAKKEEDKEGRLFKTFLILSEDVDNPASALFKNAYSKLDVEKYSYQQLLGRPYLILHNNQWESF